MCNVPYFTAEIMVKDSMWKLTIKTKMAMLDSTCTTLQNHDVDNLGHKRMKHIYDNGNVESLFVRKTYHGY